MGRLTPLKFQSGLGLLELMISIVIGLFILAGVVQLYATSTRNTASMEGLSRIQENARYVFNRLEGDISRAGYMGCFSVVGNQERVRNVVTNDSDPGELYDFTQFIAGQNDVNAGATDTDTLIVRYASAAERYPVVSSSGADITLFDGAGNNFEDGQVVIVSDCSRAAIFEVASKTNNSITRDGSSDIQFDVQGTADVNSLVEGTSLSYVYGGETAIDYQVDSGAVGVCDAGSPQNCVLKRLDVEIVQGVEDFQVEYGWQDGGVLFFAEANAVPTPEAWEMIDRVKVTATFNSIENAPTNDGNNLVRRTYSRVFLIHNQLPVTS